ncbi:VOC family protein [Planomicrobium sp. CPCC 101079]|uniref:VOC family protein n=1 Tax=Planomicrobium sp. CPCC 101079 TaxID=2599618 RepID=UPI0011B68858|nr:VOC family protein [Planomicrobium sp. CPCC 101079]TWT09318.1 extradiol dioxygenase [Planomicrobium sp. CPCC 101079]
MAKECWINLPVKDLQKSKDFFKTLGLTVNERFSDSEEMAGVVVGDHNVMVMLFPEEAFRSFTGIAVTDTSSSSEVILSISAESPEEVQEFIQKVELAGGAVFSGPGERNGFYGAGFCDLDGHRWNLLVM